MSKSSAQLAILDHELSEICLLLERQIGALLDSSDSSLPEILLRYLETRRLDSAKDLIARLQSSETECESLAEGLLDPSTGFFRHAEAFQALTKIALPELERRKAPQGARELRIWSAGCSSGQEAYSIAISVCEAVNGGHSVWKIQIVGSDIRRQALQQAERGLYPEHELREMPRALVQQYFAKVGQHYLVKPRVRHLVAFAPTNLVQPHYIGRFDCIFCMDVLPHFSRQQRAALVQHLYLYLQPGGFLFLGRGEKLSTAEPSFLVHGAPACTVYQRPLAAASAAGH